MESVQVVPLRDVNLAHFMDMIDIHVMEGYPELGCDRSFLHQNLCDIMDDNMKQIRVLVRGDEILGYYLAQTMPFIFTKKWSTIMHFIFVLPEYRGGRGFLWLINDFEEYCKAIQSYEVLVGIDSGINVDKVSRIFEKRGFNFVGNYFSKKNNGF
jgi:GNAT superfamily N-acetyltransferase